MYFIVLYSSHEVRLKWDQPTFNSSSEGYFYTVKYNKVDSSDVYFISRWVIFAYNATTNTTIEKTVFNV